MAANDHQLPFINQKGNIYGILIAPQCVAILAVAIRLYYRTKIVRCFGADDFFVLLSVLLGTLGIICLCIAVTNGFGQHFLKLSMKQITALLKAYYVTFFTYVMSTACIKISLILQFLRIFTTGHMRYVCFALLSTTALWGLASVILALIPCWPVKGAWELLTPTKCWAFSIRDSKSMVTSNETHAVINMVLDILVLLTAVKLLFAAQIEKKQRVGLSVMLVLGSLVTTCSIVRLVTMVQNKAGTAPNFDPTYETSITVILSAVEVQGAVICASIPFFWPVFSKFAYGKIVVIQEVQVQSHQIGYERDDAGTFRNSLHHRRGTDDSNDSKDMDNDQLMASRNGSAGHVYTVEQYTMEQIDPFKQSHKANVSRGNFHVE